MRVTGQITITHTRHGAERLLQRPYMQVSSKRVYKLDDGETGRLSPHAREKSDKDFITPAIEKKKKRVDKEKDSHRSRS